MPHLNNSKYVFFYRVEREKKGGGAFLSLLSYIPRIQNLRRGIWLNVML